MKLLIISNMAHYIRDNEIVGRGPTVEEINHLAGLFKEINHIACLHNTEVPLSSLPYSSKRISLIPLPPAGGPNILKKLFILFLAPLYIYTILRELPKADIVHVRCPANISLIAIVLLSLIRSPSIRWVKYAGNWQPYDKEAWSYKFQRWWLLKMLHRGVVTVNGQWPNQPKHIHSFLNPCLTTREAEEARKISSEKQLSFPLRLLFVGRLETEKGVGRALNILSKLHQKGISATLDLVGDGPERSRFEKLTNNLGINQLVKFNGWLPRPDLIPIYSAAHIFLLPSCSEGWPKVLSEAMAYGVVPIASNVGSIPQYLKRFGTGRTLPPEDEEGFENAICYYSLHFDLWKEESENGIKAAKYFSYETYLNEVKNLLKI